MRLVKNNINVRDGTGSATLLPTEPEDMWHLYNLIRPGDILRAPAIRKVTREHATGSTSSQTVRTTLTIRVIRTEFDPSVASLHVAGRVSAENEYVSIGMHHTLDLELNRQFVLEKGMEEEGAREGAPGAGRGRGRAMGGAGVDEDASRMEGWDSIALEQLKDATDMRKRAEIYAVVMQEGLAHICLVTEYQTLMRQRVEVTIPRKRGPSGDAHDSAINRFFDTLFATLLRHLDPSVYNTSTASGAGSAATPGPAATATKQPPLLLASPGFTAANFHKHILVHAGSAPGIPASDTKALLNYLRTRVVVAHSSSGHVHALAEVLKQPAVTSQLQDTRFARESELMERFLALLREDEGRAWYGAREVQRAVTKGAVGRGGGVLLISNKLFRAADVAQRRQWVALVERVRGTEGGEVRVLSSDHESGKKLEGLGDIGAILTFPLTDLDEDEDVDEVEDGGGGDGEAADGRGAEVLEGGEGDEEFMEDGMKGEAHDRLTKEVEVELDL